MTAPDRIWGAHLESEAVQQLRKACNLPVAVGVDIACRMKMSVLDLPLAALADDQPRLTRAIERETRFGIGATFRDRRRHEVADWSVTSLTAKLKDRAWAQLGTSGTGNHFVEFGELTVTNEGAGLPGGCYLGPPQPLGQPRRRPADRPTLQHARAPAASRAAACAEASRVDGSLERRRPGVLGRYGADGAVPRGPTTR